MSRVLLAGVGLHKSYASSGGGRSRDRQVLRGVDIHVHEGQLVTISGRSGSGKTTLLSVLSGFETPDSGHVQWMAQRSATPGELGWDELAIVPQSLGLLDELSLIENVTLPARVQGRAAPPSVIRYARQLLGRLELMHSTRHLPPETSQGEQQRTAIARALILQPSLLMLDEPTSHQDTLNHRRLTSILVEEVAAGRAVLAATHDPLLTARAEQVVHLVDGAVSVGRHCPRCHQLDRC